MRYGDAPPTWSRMTARAQSARWSSALRAAKEAVAEGKDEREVEHWLGTQVPPLLLEKQG